MNASKRAAEKIAALLQEAFEAADGRDMDFAAAIAAEYAPAIDALRTLAALGEGQPPTSRAAATIRFWIQERIRLGKNEGTDPQLMEALTCAAQMEIDRDHPAAPSPATPEAEGAEIQSAVNLVCNHLNEHSRELGGAGMIAEAQDYAHATALVRRYFGDKK